MLIDTKAIAGTAITVELHTIGSDWFVVYLMNDELLDDQPFYLERDARETFANPFAAMAPKPEKKEEVDRSYIQLFTKTNRGRRVAPKAPAA